MYENIRRNIRHFRLKKGLSQDQVGDFIGGLSRGAVSHWETGTHRPSIRHLPRLCYILGISYATLLGESLGVEDELAGLPEKTAERLADWFKQQIEREKERL